MNNDITKLKTKIVPILKQHNIVKAGIFGSYARGEQRPDSDIDILVELSPDKRMSLFQFAGIKVELEEHLGKKVDLVQYKQIKPIIKNYILNDEIRIL